MKYGQELSRRSVPEWKAYNLDYNEIKFIIKQVTTLESRLKNDDKTKVYTARGENRLFEALKEQYNNISLFVKSKTGEIDRRIEMCTKLVEQLSKLDEKYSSVASDPSVSLNHSSPPKINYLTSKARQAKLYKLRSVLAKVTCDVQALARFIGVQRTGFRKLLKKYTKWSKSPTKDSVVQRFLPILESPSSFTRQDFTSQFLELGLLHNVLRDAEITSINPKLLPLDLPNESLLKFDCQMVTTISKESQIFWVHPDNIVEIQLAILNHMNLVSVPTKLTKIGSFINSPAGLENIKDTMGSKVNEVFELHPNDDSSAVGPTTTYDISTNTVYFDNPKKLYSIQSSSEPGQLRWVKNSESTKGSPQSNHVMCAPVGGLRHFVTANIDQSIVNDLLTNNLSNVSLKTSFNNNTALAIDWIKKRSAKPISRIESERIRFQFTQSDSIFDNNEQRDRKRYSQGSLHSNVSTSSLSDLNNPDKTMVWACIDSNIKLSSGSQLNNLSNNADSYHEISFPHAVLEIRWKGSKKPSWIDKLAKSHLVYPVSGFTLFTHSVAIFQSDSLSQQPSWIKLLSENIDIRKLPPRPVRSKSSASLSIKNSSLAHHSESNDWSNRLNSDSNQASSNATHGILLNSNQSLLNPHSSRATCSSLGRRASTSSLPPSLTEESDNNSDTSLSTQKSKQAQLSSKRSTTQLNEQPSMVRYWNEFDNPEDDNENAFVIPGYDSNGYYDSDNDGHGKFLSEKSVNYIIDVSDRMISKVKRVFGIVDNGPHGSIGFNNSRNQNSLQHDYLYSDNEEDEENSYEHETESLDNGEQQNSRVSYSPRFKARRVILDVEEGDFELLSPSTTARDSILTFLYSFLVTVSLVTISILLGVIAAEDTDKLSSAAYIFIILGMIFGIVIGVLGMVLFFIRDFPPGSFHQIVIFLAFFVSIAGGTGGVCWLLANESSLLF
ncbi:hypothetical protein NADFUDRAFT_48979 [Nadsonia fulvescens var. elongata DSM 6958]|uniref:SPX domain-containing protein n=1 Tax=Nadsonia fulvescens var. elongata DSM 6958 TaxID=857566 RepID=A0A1E3PSC7_9ASCO|nr:hypothetical protein NADFUDRAFT_48979 [Nadsonia fulvescens var. elongata DSM 6958]